MVIGGGYCGLAAAYQLGCEGVRVTLIERDEDLGGLAGSFAVADTRLEKFYHHWFNHDVEIMRLIAELGLSGNVVTRASSVGAYYAHNLFKLSTPLDLLRFKPLPLIDRARLALFILRTRDLKDWRHLEDRTAGEWVRQMGGERSYQVLWEPLLRGKFGELADDVAAVWLWNKLKLRSKSRNKGGERLCYFRDGFAALAAAIAAAIRRQGGEILTGVAARGLEVEQGRVTGVATDGQTLAADAVLATPALPIVAELVAPHVPADYVERLRSIRYLANICVVLELSHSLSETYWLNVNDPGFPFVAVIEHTRLEPAVTYAGRHIVYLSKYLPASDPLYGAPDADVVAFTLPHLRRMFPKLDEKSVLASHVWRADYAQPLVDRGYRRRVPATRTPIENLSLVTMAQIYPEDRGTNYAVRQGRQAARQVAETLRRRPPRGAKRALDCNRPLAAAESCETSAP